jgi:hypothetical protein
MARQKFITLNSYDQGLRIKENSTESRRKGNSKGLELTQKFEW